MTSDKRRRTRASSSPTSTRSIINTTHASPRPRPFLEKLANMLGMYAKLRSSALVVSALLDFFTFSLCAPYSETTDGNHFDTLLQIIAGSLKLTDG